MMTIAKGSTALFHPIISQSFNNVINNTALFIKEERNYSSMFMGTYSNESSSINQDSMNTYYLALSDHDAPYTYNEGNNRIIVEPFTVDKIPNIIENLGKPWKTVLFELGGEKLEVPMYVKE